ncbi:MAG: MaoC family dehydratase [Anaerolineaceae bacterium]|nr:MaoC family dehydratase [Anaerolineaceae bacterium]MCB9097910.1 MaoC family dehydratase [Anaerolineales bacterium]
MATEGYALATIHEFVGHELGVSDWLTIDQERISQFAACTSDHQWIHVDVERARRESPYGSTIAHGYLILALLSQFQYEVELIPAGVAQAINYGVERVRFLAPVKPGARIRDRVTLLAAENKGDRRVLLTVQNTVEIAGENKPAMIAETLAMLIGR